MTVCMCMVDVLVIVYSMKYMCCEYVMRMRDGAYELLVALAVIASCSEC